MVHRALSNLTYLSLGLLSSLRPEPVKHIIKVYTTTVKNLWHMQKNKLKTNNVHKISDISKSHFFYFLPIYMRENNDFCPKIKYTLWLLIGSRSKNENKIFLKSSDVYKIERKTLHFSKAFAHLRP